MRILIVMIFSGFILKAQALNPNGCLEQIAKNEQWIVQDPKQFSCITNKTEFKSIAKILCSVDHGDISKNYKVFLEFSEKIKIAWAQFQAATTPAERAQASTELQDLQRRQSTYGHTNGIWDALDAVNGAKFQCE